MNLQNLPDVVMEKIFSYLTFNQIAGNRIISRKFNELGKELLNRGYYMVERYHKRSIKAVKSQFPRRESERKTHPLARRYDTLVAIETRLSMLSMTFLKYIETKQCCFIPGKVLDELLRVLRCANATTSPPFDLLQELRDISSMAMEHFDEVIAPQLIEKLATNKANASLLSQYSLGERSSSSMLNYITFKDFGKAFRQNLLRTKSNCNNITYLAVETHNILKKSVQNKKIVKRVVNRLSIQGRQIKRLHRQLKEISAELRSLSRRNVHVLPTENSLQEDAVQNTDSHSAKRRKNN